MMIIHEVCLKGDFYYFYSRVTYFQNSNFCLVMLVHMCPTYIDIISYFAFLVCFWHIKMLGMESRINESILNFMSKLKSSAPTQVKCWLRHLESVLWTKKLYKWYKLFTENRNDVNDDARPGRPRTLTTDKNVETVNKSIKKNHRID